MTQILTKYSYLPYNTYIVPGTIPEYIEEEDEDDYIEIEEGFVELELGDQTLNENIEWLYEEELSAQTDGPRGPIIIKKGRYTKTN